ncbi:M3 family metallopeptidase [Zongyangia hominis]|uniref:Peptidase M3A/M3B catalytic domain-containing protein n=1 Tax=Zongyangia hominis TaxID=2763677 RepID=A0A926ECM2_9FIRM|nr:M3 family metallopeptidase [Zongyangia hominis]MBC8569676.1 hypothetical protein [Zongyangia hominis]
MALSILFSSCAVIDNALDSITGLFRGKPQHKDIDFSQMTYTRPDGDALLALVEKAVTDFDGADSAEKQMEVCNSFSQDMGNFNYMYTIAQIHSYLDATDTFYQDEMSYLDEMSAKIDAKRNTLFRKLVDSPYREDLTKLLGDWQMEDLTMTTKTSAEEVAELKVRENQLVTEYNYLSATATIDYFGEEKLFSSLDSNLQYYLLPVYYQKYNEILGAKFLELISVRQEMAQKLGYDNFIGMGYDAMGRSCYGVNDVEALRADVKKYMVPLYKKMIEQAQLDAANGSDHPSFLLSSDVVPVGGYEGMVENFWKATSQISDETKESSAFMRRNHLYDFEKRENKTDTDMTTIIGGNYYVPYMFISVSGDSFYDATTLLHEFGHYNAMYHKVSPHSYFGSESRSIDVAEIYSQGMEFVAFPYYEDFFGKGADDAKKSQVFSKVETIVNATMQDEFQHRVYAKKDITLEEINEIWADLYKEYGMDLLTSGDMANTMGLSWIDIPHFFLVPFYSIDYTVSASVALQVWEELEDDWQDGYDTYEKLVEAPANLNFLEVIEEAGVDSPFEQDSMKVLSEKIEVYLTR